MAHEINALDRQQGIFMGWHGLTEMMDPSTFKIGNSWLSQWDLMKMELTFTHPISGNTLPTPFSMFVCTDDPTIIVGNPFDDKYTPIYNKKFIEVIEKSVMGITGLQLATVGSVCTRTRIFASFELLEGNMLAAGRATKLYLNFFTSHDKSCPFTFNVSTIAIVCNNTFNMNLHSKDNTLRSRVKHTKNALLTLDNVPAIIDAAMGAGAEFKRNMDIMADKPLAVDDARKVFAAILSDSIDTPTNELKELSTKSFNRMNELTKLFIEGKGNNGDDRADGFNALTDFYSHYSAGQDKTKQFESSEFGRAGEQKQIIYDLFNDDMKFSQLVYTGNKILSLT